MTNSKHAWSVPGLLLFLLVICLAEPSQGFGFHGLRERAFNSQDVEIGGYKTLSEGKKQESNEHPDENSVAVLPSYATRKRRNVIDDAKQTVKSTTEKLSWVKKNFRYLLLMVGSIFFLFFSCAVYRRLTRDRDDEGDDIKVVVIGGPKETSPASGTSSSPVSVTNKGSKTISNSNKTMKHSKLKTKKRKKNENVQSTGKKVESMRTEPEQGTNDHKSESNFRNNYSDDADDCDSSDGEYNLEVPVCEYSDVTFCDLENVCVKVKRENGINRNKKSLSDALLNQKKKPFAQIKIDACIINEGIPLSSYTSFQQTHQSEAELCDPTMQYVDEIRERAELLYGKRQVTHSSTSCSQYPVLDDLKLNIRLARVATILERCGHYHPMASTDTRLPVTAKVE